MWVAPEVRDPVLMHAPTRKSVACFGAVSLSTGRFVWQVCPVFNAETFVSFLRRLLRHRRRGKRIVVVLDNAKYHPCQHAQATAAQIQAGPDVAVPPAIQPATGTYRTGLEADKASGAA
ncbi:DDE superfamily endonuclease [Burkholderia sp. D7]|nr:DDE superfamily endonuclease [Burkholderia sp. D7]